MNETPLDSVSGDGGEWGELSTLRETGVRELLVTLGKALRAYQLYEENNPVYQRFVTALRDSFRELWSHEERLTLVVEESRLVLDHEPVYVNESRSESLAFGFYKDGIREITFLPGIEEDEVERFLAVLHHARHAGPDSDDLLTILWQESLQCFRYSYVDFLAEGVTVPEAGPGADLSQLEAAREELVAELEGGEAEGDAAESGRAGQPEAVQTVSRESFNPTLYALDPKEMEQLEREVQLEMGRDLRGHVLNALFDRLEEPSDPERQSQIVGIFRTLLPTFLGRGALDAAARVLEELRKLLGLSGAFDDQRRQDVTELLDEISSPEVMGELIRALEDGSVVPSPPQLAAFLSHLSPQALAPLLRASETVVVKELQPVLRKAVGAMASRTRRMLAGLLSSDDALVVAGAARLAGALQVAEAGGGLQSLLKHADPAVRLAAVEAAVQLRASTVAGPLQDTLTDPNRDVRIAAARALGKLRYRPAARHFRSLIIGKEIRAVDITEKIAFFEGYGELGDPEAVGLLDKLLNGKGLLGRREPGEIRAAAALGLSKVGTPEALKALESAVSDEDPVVRSAVNRALREATEARP